MNTRPLFFILTIILFATELVPTSAQVNDKGNPLMVAYDYAQTGGSEWNYSILKDDRGIMYFGNEVEGVLEFDGVNWNSININSDPVIFSLEKSDNGLIYLSGSYEFGYMEPDRSGRMVYSSLSARLDSAAKSKLGDVYEVKSFNNTVYFLSKRTVYSYNYSEDLLDSLKASDRFFTMQRLYTIGERLIVADNREGLTQLSGDSLRMLPGGDYFGRDYCFSVLPYEDDWCIVGTYYKGLHLYNLETGEVRNDFISEADNNQLMASQIYNGTILNDGNIAIGTMSDGVFIFNREGKLLERYSNESLDLHDDQVYYMYHDKLPYFSSQLWLAVVEKIYRLAYNLPVRYLDRRNGVTFPVSQVSEFQGNLYVCGDKGVARLSRDGDKLVFKELEGLSHPTNTLVPVLSNDGEKLILAATLNDLFIIDESEKVSRFIDVLANPSAEVNVGPNYNITPSRFHNGVFFVGLNRKLRVVEYRNGRWSYNYSVEGFSGRVSYLVEESESRLWVSTTDMDRLYTVDILETDTLTTEYSGTEIEGHQVQAISKINNRLVLVTNKGIFEYNDELEKFEEQLSYMIPQHDNIIYEDIIPLGDKGVLVKAYDTRNFEYIVKPDGSRIMDIFFLLPKSYTGGLMQKDNILWLPKQQEIFLLDLDRVEEYEYVNDVLIREVTIGDDSLLFCGTFFERDENDRLLRVLKHQPQSQVHKISHSHNDITFHWSSNNYFANENTEYSYMIEGFDRTWSRWQSVNYKDYTNLQHGKYKFLIKARGATRHETDITVYEFEILRAWYQSVIAMIVYGLLIILTVIMIIKVYTRRLINENVRLEGIVAERTKEVVRQKEELESSIHYASRIQRAILPSEKALKDKVEEYFILFRPRDIVSGDFYWVSEKGSRLYIVAADCTGHGVPGAFMSILGISFLDEIINKADNTATDTILNTLRKHVTDSLKQMEEGVEETKDGMDLGILVVNYEDNEIEFSGAYNPCWVVRELTDEEKDKYLKNELEIERNSVCNGEYLLETIDADRMPIGISSRMDQSFKMHKQKLEKGVSYYLLSDGYSDQFGGENGRKFLKKNLKKLILEVQGLPMKQQRDLLEKRLVDWMGEHDQVDDILVMGVRVI